MARLASDSCTHHRELARLRRDLHDGLGPSLAGILARADVLAALVGQESRDVREILGELRREATSFLGEMRRVLADRAPAELEGRDLAAGLAALGSRMSTGLAVEVMVDDVSGVSWANQVTAFWIAKEALTNVVKHSDASRCTIRISTDAGLHMSIVDNGRGGVGTPGLGLPSMRERATEQGGWCHIENTGQGVSVTAYLPEGECHDHAA